MLLRDRQGEGYGIFCGLGEERRRKVCVCVVVCIVKFTKVIKNKGNRTPLSLALLPLLLLLLLVLLLYLRLTGTASGPKISSWRSPESSLLDAALGDENYECRRMLESPPPSSKKQVGGRRKKHMTHPLLPSPSFVLFEGLENNEAFRAPFLYNLHFTTLFNKSTSHTRKPRFIKSINLD